MNKLAMYCIGTAAAVLMGCPEPASTTFDVTVENVSTEGLLDTERLGGAVPLSPGVYAVHEGDNPAFLLTDTAPPGTEMLAEDGRPGGEYGGMLLDEIQELDRVQEAGLFASPGGPDNGPALAPGEQATFTIEASPGDQLTLLTMFVQSNDWFYALDALELFDGGTPISGDYTDALTLYDAGTEEDTAPGTGDFQAPVQDEGEFDVGPAEDEPVTPATERHADFDIPETSQVIRLQITARDTE
jgi:hypothetical protein